MLNAESIRKHLQDFLSGAIHLETLEDWIASASWNMHKHAESKVQQFIGAIELRLAEHSSGHLDDSDLRHEFEMFLIHGYDLPMSRNA